MIRNNDDIGLQLQGFEIRSWLAASFIYLNIVCFTSDNTHQEWEDGSNLP